MFRPTVVTLLGLLLFGLLLLGGVSYGQDALEEDDGVEGDVPEWLEDFGFEHHVGDGLEEPETAVETAPNAAGPAPTCTCIHCRQRLTGDWGGHRSALQKRGVFYRGKVTQYFFGIAGGVQPPVPPPLRNFGISGGDTFEYTGNSRHDLLFALDKFGGPAHGKFVFTAENLWGQFGNVSLDSGSSTPAIFNAVMPVDPEASGTLYATNLMYVQPVSERLVLSAGKTRMIGLADRNIFAGGDGSDQFFNQAFCGNPLFVGQIPLSTFAVSAVMPQEWGNISVFAFDPVERTREFLDFGTIFQHGVMLFGQVKVNTDFLDKPGEHHLGATYLREDLLNLRFTPIPPSYPNPPAPPGTPQFLTKPESYTIFYGFDQYLSVYGSATKRGAAPGWGIFGRAGISDGATGNPNFSAWHVSGGFGGDSPWECRRDKGDRFGIGYGYTATSTEWGAIPRAIFGPRDSQFIECYYRYHLTPATRLSPDVQWVQGNLGGLSQGSDSLIFGLRLDLQL